MSAEMERRSLVYIFCSCPCCFRLRWLICDGSIVSADFNKGTGINCQLERKRTTITTHSSAIVPLLPLSIPFAVYPPNFFLHQQDFGNLLQKKSAPMSPRQLVSFSSVALLPKTFCLECKTKFLRGLRVLPTLWVFWGDERGLLHLCNSPLLLSLFPAV